MREGRSVGENVRVHTEGSDENEHTGGGGGGGGGGEMHGETALRNVLLLSSRAIEQTFHHKQQYVERIATCNALILHLQRLSITNSHTGVAALPEMDGANSSPPTSSTNLDSVPLRSESDPTAAAGASSNDVGGFILRRERDEVLVPPTIVSLKRKKSKKEKRRNVPIVRKEYCCFAGYM